MYLIQMHTGQPKFNGTLPFTMEIENGLCWKLSEKEFRKLQLIILIEKAKKRIFVVHELRLII